MMNEDRPAAGPEKNKISKARSLGRRLIRGLTHQWGWKLMSLVLAMCLWGVLISQDSALPRDKVISGIRVSVINAASLRSSGYIVVDGLDELGTVSIRARVPQKNYSAVSASNFTARLDLSQIQEAGQQKAAVTVASTNAGQYGTVLEVLSPEILLTVEEYGTQARVPVEVRLEGEVPEQYFAGALSRTVEYVDISGPKSKVERVARCVVSWDQSALTPDRSPNTANLPFTFEDAEGAAVDAENISATVSGQSSAVARIGVSQEVYYKAQVPVNTDSLYTGAPAEGYAVSSVRVSPESVTIAGSKEAIAPYLEPGSTFYTYEQVDIDGQNRTVSGFLTLRSPQNMDYISASAVQVIVSILPEAFVNAASDGEVNP